MKNLPLTSRPSTDSGKFASTLRFIEESLMSTQVIVVLSYTPKGTFTPVSHPITGVTDVGFSFLSELDTTETTEWKDVVFLSVGTVFTGGPRDQYGLTPSTLAHRWTYPEEVVARN
ncbi:MAG: hypothetical protein V4697_02105 [Patescibacteria group bacterium]